MDKCSPDSHVYIIVEGLRHDKFLVTLTSFYGQGLVYRIPFQQMGGVLQNLYGYIILDNL